ncbi:MAG: hypothetical protein QF864_09600 [SAR202 cluster bacterium]|nr:hypothetical protein [SAR202 cluster bacterium]
MKIKLNKKKVIFTVLIFLILFVININFSKSTPEEGFPIQISEKNYGPIIEITKAKHLEENRILIKDIYDKVKKLDDNWSETILEDEHIRVTFENPLNNDNDITIYSRIISGNPIIEVYEVNGDEMIAKFGEIMEDKYNKIYLTNLNGSQDTFDLRVVGGSIEMDHIIDPQSNFYTYTGSVMGGNLGIDASNTGLSHPFHTGTAVTYSNLVQAFASDDVYYQTSIADQDNEYDWQIYHFNIAHPNVFSTYLPISSPSQVTSLFLSWEGHSRVEISNYDLSTFIWNVDSGLWETIGSDSDGAASDITFSTTITSNLEDYINATEDGLFVYMYSRHQQSSILSSCPFVYSYNGENWIQDHESFPFSVIKSAQTTTFDRLKHLKEVDGKYKIKIAEELNETSFVDMFKLFIVDHNGTGFVMPDIKGKMHTIQNLTAPLSCYDSQNISCLDKIKKQDNWYWKENFKDIDITKKDTWRNEIEITFDKPQNYNNKAKLFFNIRKLDTMTEFWKFYLNSIGENYWPFWQKVLSTNQFSFLFNQAFKKSINLKFEVWDGEKWEVVGHVNAGRNMLEDFLIEIDLTNNKIKTNKDLKIKASSIKGFYEIDYLAIDYSQDEEMIITKIKPEIAVLNNQTNVKNKLFKTDENYVNLNIGDEIDLTYNSIPKKEGFNRDFSISINGYYNFVDYNNQTFFQFLKGTKNWIYSLLSPEEIPKLLYEENLNKHNTLFTDRVYGIANYTTCNVPTTGGYSSENWVVNCSENCIWDSNFIVPENMILNDSGTITLNANLSMNGSGWEIYKEENCTIVINPGGGIK